MAAAVGDGALLLGSAESNAAARGERTAGRERARERESSGRSRFNRRIRPQVAALGGGVQRAGNAAQQARLQRILDRRAADAAPNAPRTFAAPAEGQRVRGGRTRGPRNAGASRLINQ